MQQAKQFY